MNRLRRINPILPEFLGNLLLYGILVQVVGVWFVRDKLSYTLSLWVGIGLAIGMAIHMAVLILDAVDSGVKRQAQVKATTFCILRYVIVGGVLALATYFGLGNVIAIGIGIFGVKVAALLYPFTKEFFAKFKKEVGA